MGLPAGYPPRRARGVRGRLGIATVFGVEEGDAAPVPVGLLALVVALVLFAVPTGLAWRFANRARARGDDRARVPAIMLTTLVAVFIGQNVIAWLAAILAA